MRFLLKHIAHVDKCTFYNLYCVILVVLLKTIDAAVILLILIIDFNLSGAANM